MTIRLSFEIKNRPKIGEEVGEFVAHSPHLLGHYAVRELQAHGSDWPVKTGLSKASFGHSVYANRATITNTTNYAKYVEQRTGAAFDTISRNLDRIKEKADEELAAVIKAFSNG